MASEPRGLLSQEVGLADLLVGSCSISCTGVFWEGTFGPGVLADQPEQVSLMISALGLHPGAPGFANMEYLRPRLSIYIYTDAHGLSYGGLRGLKSGFEGPRGWPWSVWV